MNTASFSMSEILEQQQDSHSHWLEFLRTSNLSMGVYRIPKGTNDRDTHTPHDEDEVYLTTSGKGKLTADGQEFAMETGAIVFVKAGIDHHFHDIDEDLNVLVFFSATRVPDSV